ncbi:Uncharacterized membrane protein YkvA, DUF1232 family [Paenibacillus sp. cl141a]|nr:Uncharacterized membrane protein YkvA, DUF1232 family [Paenibacillus sp. cl141a]
MREAKVLTKAKDKAREIKRNVFVLFLAYKDPRVPWYAKLFAVLVVAYAFSPIDLIPDFIPVLGYLDDLIIVPLGITIALKMIPQSVIEQCRAKAEEIRKQGKPKNWVTGEAIRGICTWRIGFIGRGTLFISFSSKRNLGQNNDVYGRDKIIRILHVVRLRYQK